MKEIYEALKLEELDFELKDYAEARLLGEMARIGYIGSYEVYIRIYIIIIIVHGELLFQPSGVWGNIHFIIAE